MVTPLLPFFHPPRRRREPFPLVTVVGLFSIAVVALSITLYPVTQGIGNVANALSRINPAEVIGAIVTPMASIPVTQTWCKAIGIGCGPDRHAAFKTEKFGSLQRTHSTGQISIGTDVFDCLNDLRITRQQENSTSHLMTLSRKVMQFGHVLEAPEDLRDNLAKLAETLKTEFLYNANTARVMGSNGIRKILDEINRFRWRSLSSALANICSNLSPARQDLNSTAFFLLSSAQAVKEVEELTKLVGQQAHKEISRLHNIQNEEESGLGYFAYGWTEPSWKFFQPGWVGIKEQRQEAALFLKEVIQAIDEGETPMTRNALSLQQCAINIEDFNHQIERACSSQEPLDELIIDAQLEQFVRLQIGHDELKRKYEAEQQAIAGETTPSSSFAEIGYPLEKRVWKKGRGTDPLKKS